MVDRACGVLAVGAEGAARSLVELATDGKPKDRIRLAAARSVIDLGARLLETIAIIDRIEALEAKIAEAYGGRRRGYRQ